MELSRGTQRKIDVIPSSIFWTFIPSIILACLQRFNLGDSKALGTTLLPRL